MNFLTSFYGVSSSSLCPVTWLLLKYILLLNNPPCRNVGNCLYFYANFPFSIAISYLVLVSYLCLSLSLYFIILSMFYSIYCFNFEFYTVKYFIRSFCTYVVFYIYFIFYFTFYTNYLNFYCCYFQ